jgi:hypothetical protein
MTEFTTEDGAQTFCKDLGCRATDRLQPRVTGL